MRFGEYLITRGALNQEALNNALRNQQLTKDKLGQSLIKEGVIRKERLNLLLANYFGMEYLSLEDFNPDSDAIALIPRYIARKMSIIPVSLKGNILTIAVTEPLVDSLLDNLKRITGKRIETVFIDPDSMSVAFKYVYKNDIDSDEFTQTAIQENFVNLDVKEVVEKIINTAVELNASDVHLEPEADKLRIRLRVDGYLKTYDTLSEALGNLAISRLKVLSGMNIAEKRSPQDAALQYPCKFNNKTVNIRVSTIPSCFGEKMVLRMQTKGRFEELENLGFEADHLAQIHSTLGKPHGIFLTTGPSGSGKTTTLYAALKLLRSDSLNIITVEDPIERPLKRVIQTEIDYQKYNFETALRSILRQDPDVIMVGEIRDGSTARLALQAALTGHLVLSTIHTNDATSAVAQFIDMGCEQFLVNAAVNAVLAQRLVRRLCPECKRPYEPDAEELTALGLDPHKKEVFYTSDGCPACHGLRYKGRIGIYELLVLDSGFKKLISQNADPQTLRNYAIKNGMRTLREDAILKMRQGLTSFSEVIVTTPNELQE